MGIVRRGKLGSVSYQLIQWLDKWTLIASDAFGGRTLHQDEGMMAAILLGMVIDLHVQYSQGLTARN